MGYHWAMDMLRRHWALGASGVVFAAALIYLGLAVTKDLERLSTAQSDNLQWNVMQAETDFLQFSNALLEVKAEPDLPLDELRRRFDVLYSRISMLDRGLLDETLSGESSFRQNVATAQSFLEQAIPVIDASDEELRQRLPELEAMAKSTRQDIRSLATDSLMRFSEVSAERRVNFAATLAKLATTVAVLVAALVVAVIYLKRASAEARRQQSFAEASARRSEVIMETALDGVIVADMEGRIVGFNAAAEAMYGRSADEVIGQDLAPIVIPDHMRAAHDAGMKRMRAGGEKRVVGQGRVRLQSKRANGRLFPLELAIQTAETDEGTVFIAFLRDISAQVAAEAELVDTRDRALAADKLKGEFIATMSHEIRTPLNGLLGNLTLIKDTKLDKLQKRYIHNMSTSGELLLKHVSDVLDLSRYEGGDVELLKVPVNFAGMVQAVVSSQSGMAEQRNTVMEWHWATGTPNWVLSDPDAIQHVLINLVGNAVKFTSGGRVSLSVEASPTADGKFEYVLHVADSGKGIAPELLEHIFDPFVTGDAAYDREVGGTGLGLGIALRSVQALGGTIDVESEVGVGTTFEVRLPMEATTANDKVLETKVPLHRTKSLRILVVEDNMINQQVVGEMLRKDGHEPVMANNGAEAVAIANEEYFDLILMDISMPVMDGKTATRQIRASGGINARTKIIALTANAMKSEQLGFIEDGMDDLLIKPLARDALRAKLQTIFPEQTGSSSTTVDERRNELKEVMGAEEYEKILKRFFQQVEDLNRLLAGSEVTDLTRVAAECHNVCGVARLLGADKYGEILANIEIAAKEGDQRLVQKLRRNVGDVWNAERQFAEAY